MGDHVKTFLTQQTAAIAAGTLQYARDRKATFEQGQTKPIVVPNRKFKEANELDKHLVFTFKLWVKFKDGNCRTFFAPCVQTTYDQYKYQRLINIDFKSGYLVLLDRIKHYLEFNKTLEIHLYKTTNNTRIGHWLLDAEIELEQPEFKATRVELTKHNLDRWATYIDLSNV